MEAYGDIPRIILHLVLIDHPPFSSQQMIKQTYSVYVEEPHTRKWHLSRTNIPAVM